MPIAARVPLQKHQAIFLVTWNSCGSITSRILVRSYSILVVSELTTTRITKLNTQVVHIKNSGMYWYIPEVAIYP